MSREVQWLAPGNVNARANIWTQASDPEVNALNLELPFCMAPLDHLTMIFVQGEIREMWQLPAMASVGLTNPFNMQSF